jgi:hypothetical protein
MQNTLLDEVSVFSSVPAPRKDDKLFCAAADDWQTNAYIAKWDVGYAYCSGYRTAAFSLSEKVCETYSEQDKLVYPIVYLYRHHVELALKGITVVASALLDKELTDHELNALGRHQLNELWKNLKPMLNPVCKLVQDDSFPIEDIEGIESYINQLHEHDPDGQRFRYATIKQRQKKTKREEASLKEDLRHINIRVFATGMEKLAEYLECIEGWFGDLLDTKYEMQRNNSY